MNELYLSLHLSWVLDPFVHNRFQNLKTSEDTFGHDITPLILRHLDMLTNNGLSACFLPTVGFEFV